MPKSSYKIYDTTSEAWKAMKEAILGAKKSIYWEMYILVDDEVGNDFLDILEKRAKQGLDVKLVLDYFGSFWISKKRINKLKASGVDIKMFQDRKIRLRGFWKFFGSRNHRKIMVIDENIGFIGGVNIQKHMKDWYDIQVVVTGSVVHSLLRAFARSYIMCGGKRKEVRHLLKYKFRVVRQGVDFIYDRGAGGGRRSNARKRYSEALLKARERVILFSPYYFPDKELRRALWKAKKRGIRVDLLIPFRADVRMANYVNYAKLSLMEKLGVHVHLSKRMMHGKGVIVDDEWAMVGSSNLDQVSFYENHEANIRLEDKRVVKKLKRILNRWIAGSEKFDSKTWKKRGRGQRLMEWLSIKLYNYWFKVK